jgi:hypothetical protein
MNTHRMTAAALTGIAIAVLIIAILAACQTGGGSSACAAPTARPAATIKPAQKTTKPAAKPTVTVTRNGTYHVDIDADCD